MSKGNVVEMPKPEPVTASNMSMARDAASVRRMVVKTLRQFRRGEISITEAGHVSTLSKRALDAMKIEFLAGPRLAYAPSAIDEDDD